MPQEEVKVVDLTNWNLLEQIEELRGKLHLKERDAKAYYESAEAKKIQNERLVAKLREENKKKRIVLSDSINGDEMVIRSVFHHRREELLSMKRYTVAEAMGTMDQKVCEASKRLNELQHQRNQREDRLHELQVILDRQIEIDSTNYMIDREREIRRLQNEMDKARIKYEAARNISRRYEEILKHMQEECRMYPAKLGNLEEIVSDAKDELDILCQMNEKAIKSSEEARKDLHTMEREMYQSKRSRDQQLNETRKEVERRKEPSDRAEKRTKVNLVSDTSDSKGARLLLQKADRQEKILTLEEGFETIKSAINVSDIEDVVFRVANQGNTHERLVKQEKEKMRAKEKLLNEKNKLQTVFEELKFTSQRQVAKGRKLVEAMQDYMKTEEKQRDYNVKEMLKNEKLLLDLQSGITTLNEKLSNVKLKPPYHNYTKGDPVDDLLVCARKLEMLLSETAIRKYLEGTSHRVDHNKLHTYLEGKLPPENIRIRIDTDDGSDEDEFHFDHDQDNDGLMSRDDIKKLGTDLMNSKLKTKKKKGRKARAN